MFDGHTALVTGGGRGIGRAIAHVLARNGANVAVMARSTEEVSDVADELGPKGFAVAGDVSSREWVENAVKAAASHFGGPVDILVNNAAVVGPISPLHKIDPDEWVRAQAINVNGVMYGIAAVIGEMLNQGWGRILNITSGAATGTGIRQVNAYSVSKAAVDMITRNGALDLEGTGVTINALSPGTVDTDMQTYMREAPVEQLGEATKMLFEGFQAKGQLVDAMAIGVYAVAILASDRNGEIISRRQFPESLEMLRQQVI